MFSGRTPDSRAGCGCPGRRRTLWKGAHKAADAFQRFTQAIVRRKQRGFVVWRSNGVKWWCGITVSEEVIFFSNFMNYSDLISQIECMCVDPRTPSDRLVLGRTVTDVGCKFKRTSSFPYFVFMSFLIYFYGFMFWAAVFIISTM